MSAKELETATEQAGAAANENAERSFDDLTLDELLVAFYRAPKNTWRQLTGVIRRRDQAEPALTTLRLGDELASSSEAASRPRPGGKQSTRLTSLALSFVALLSGLIGTTTLLGPGYGAYFGYNALEAGAPFLWLAFGIWLCAELVGRLPQLREHWRKLDKSSRAGWLSRILPLALALSAVFDFTGAVASPPEQLPRFAALSLARVAGSVLLWRLIDFALKRKTGPSPVDAHAAGMDSAPLTPGREGRFVIGRKRLALAAVLILNTALLWANTSDNSMPQPYFALWIMGSFGWALLFAPRGWHAMEWATKRIDAWRRIDWRGNRRVIALFTLILLMGIGFRLEALQTLPGEMTADHVEKLLDSVAISQGATPVYLTNNGGREPMQMYIVAFLAQLPWFGFDFYTLKFASALEGILALPLIFWLGAELPRHKPRRFRLGYGLIMMALTAVSFWHVIISRQGLRIPLTLIFVCLILIHLARAMRFNQRADYLKAALALGFCLYAYQAARLMPLFIGAGIFIAVVARDISWRERWRYAVNLAILAFVALMVYLPMLHFAIEEPDAYWGRLNERMIGSELASGAQEITAAQLQTAAHSVLTNLRDALLMFNWKGNSGWFNGPPDHPVMDTITGALLVAGCGAWAAMLLKSRDPALWFIPVFIVIMLLPSALSTAFPEANPSSSRAFNVIAGVYALAAMPMALISEALRRTFGKRIGAGLALLFCGLIALFAYGQNRHTYFSLYARNYQANTWPHTEAGEALRGFVVSDGAVGNVFSVGFVHWWDYRAIGIEAGYMDIDNDASPIDAFPEKLRRALVRNDRYRLDTSRDILIFLHVNDNYARERLQTWFPDGRLLTIQSYHPEDRYDLFRVPNRGDGGWIAFLSDAAIARG